MPNALIGFSGFVGNMLLRQTTFDACYRSTNISQIDGKIFDTVVCAAAPAQKWLANKNPQSDRNNINDLINHLKTIRCQQFILISTVDVFQSPLNLHAYGLNRRYLEKFVEAQFSNCLIVRLPGLVGPGLRKNIIFDFLNKNNLNMIESRSIFQFYPMINLWYDVKIALKANLRLVHLTSAPLLVSEVAQQGFGRPFEQVLSPSPIEYDMRTKYASLFDTNGCYTYTKRETILAIRAYAQSEPLATLIKPGMTK
jgi:hypothetical protein